MEKPITSVRDVYEAIGFNVNTMIAFKVRRDDDSIATLNVSSATER